MDNETGTHVDNQNEVISVPHGLEDTQIQEWLESLDSTVAWTNTLPICPTLRRISQ